MYIEMATTYLIEKVGDVSEMAVEVATPPMKNSQP
jgi:hypothetical protein